jgi:hypothetical protein
VDSILTATTATSIAPPVSRAEPHVLSIPDATALLPVTMLSAFVLGYHPYAEDAGIYMAGVKRLLDPSLFPIGAEFITGYTQLSFFGHLLAGLVRFTHLPIEWCAFGLHIFVLWLFLFGCLLLARKLFSSTGMRWAAVITVSLCLGTPVAGTSLFLSDPYLTGRSFIAPLTLFAACAVLDRSWLRTLICIAAAALFHPLMAIYLAAIVFALWIARWCRARWLLILPLIAILSGAIITFSQRNVVESHAYVQAVLTRTYFYLESWHWYETLGITLPILLLLIFAGMFRQNENARAVAVASAVAGISSALPSLIFVHRGSSSHMLARLQVLREFQFIYLLMFLLVGAMVGRYFLRQSIWRWAVYIILLSAGLFIVQRATYPASPQMQLPWREPLMLQNEQNDQNQWLQAFLWIRANTPRDAVFALDPHYINAVGEDAEGFRATAERSALADYSKDGGAAAIFPDLAEKWQRENAAADGINLMSDAERRARLVPLGATWVVLSHSAVTAFDCPYNNHTVAVCRML